MITRQTLSTAASKNSAQAPVFPPLAKGGSGGVVPAQPITGFSTGLSRPSLPEKAQASAVRAGRGVRPHPPSPPP